MKNKIIRLILVIVAVILIALRFYSRQQRLERKQYVPKVSEQQRQQQAEEIKQKNNEALKKIHESIKDKKGE